MSCLKDDLLSDDDGVVISALSALDTLLRKSEVGADYVPLLCRLLSRNDEVRTKALWCIGKLGQNKQGDSESLTIVSAMAADPEPENRENAAWALGELAGTDVGNRESLDSLISLLDDEDTHVRAMAAWSVGRYADKLGIVRDSSLEPLHKMAAESSAYLKKSAEFALERIMALSDSAP